MMSPEFDHSDNLRREYNMYSEYLALLDGGETGKLREKFEANLERIKINAQIKGISL